MQSTTCRQPGLRVTEHTLKVPLDHAQPAGEQIEVFARAVVLAEKADSPQPWLLFLQGGPGFEGPRPLSADTPGWLSRALADYRVLLLDQRGMGVPHRWAWPMPSARPRRPWPNAWRCTAPTPSSGTPSVSAKRWTSTAGRCWGRALAASAR